MYRFLPARVLGCLTLSLIVLNTFVVGGVLLPVAAVKFVVPADGWRRAWTRVLLVIAECWTRLNSVILALTQPTRWEFSGLDNPALSTRGRYMITSNHQTWSDVMLLQQLLTGYVPFLRFFIKQELFWLPILGQAWWALDMPFMKRYPPAVLAKHPELRGKDLEATRRACEHYRHGPIAIMNFVEGTRFTTAKHAKQQSPYRHLLKPRTGGMAAALDAFSGNLTTLVNVTVVYSSGRPNLWEFLSGQVEQVIAEVEVIEIPADLCRGDYAGDAAYRERFQTWITALWEAKDVRFEELSARLECRGGSGAAATGAGPKPADR